MSELRSRIIKRNKAKRELYIMVSIIMVGGAVGLIYGYAKLTLGV